MFTTEGAESAEVFIGKHKTRPIGFSINNLFSAYSAASAVRNEGSAFFDLMNSYSRTLKGIQINKE
ncbi:hypothetical protein C5610_02600 [Idiomarina sp. OT37-5b]|nr:hypothetical protein C5610_02600 [Idiomarina sp. OT37-5b]